MSPQPHYLAALDAGTGAGRCLIIDTEGQHVSSAYREWSYTAPEDALALGVEFDPDSFWRTLADATRDAMAKAGICADDVIAVSTTSMREGFVLLDNRGKEIFSVPNRDLRGWAENQELEQAYGERIFQTSGHWPLPIFAPARLLWLGRHRPETLARAATLLMINDWIAYRLSGVVGCEPSNAAETSVYDIRKLQWDTDLIKDLDLPVEIFPTVRIAGTVLGEVTPDAAALTGLRAGTPVVVGGADTQCGVLGSGGITPGQTVAVTGTSTPVQMVLEEPLLDAQARTWSGPHVVPGRWVLEAGCTSGSTLRWFRDTFCQAEVAEAKRTGRDVYDLMTEKAESCPIGSEGIFALLGAVIKDARHLLASLFSTGGFVMSPVFPIFSKPQGKDLFVRAILESFAYAIRGNSEMLVSISGKELQQLLACGGSSSNSRWVRMLANVMGIPVQVPRITEATALGSALCAGVGVGCFSDFDAGVEALVHPGMEVLPEPTAHKEYELFYRRWTSLQEQMKDISLQSK